MLKEHIQAKQKRSIQVPVKIDSKSIKICCFLCSFFVSTVDSARWWDRKLGTFCNLFFCIRTLINQKVTETIRKGNLHIQSALRQWYNCFFETETTDCLVFAQIQLCNHKLWIGAPSQGPAACKTGGMWSRYSLMKGCCIFLCCIFLSWKRGKS